MTNDSYKPFESFSIFTFMLLMISIIVIGFELNPVHGLAPVFPPGTVVGDTGTNPKLPVHSIVKIDDTNSLFDLILTNLFGWLIVNMGDLDGDRITDLAVGAPGDTYGDHYGAIYILFMNSDGTVKNVSKIGNLSDSHRFGMYDSLGTSISNIGDIDNNGVSDLVAGTNREITNGNTTDILYILFMNRNGTVKDVSEFDVSDVSSVLNNSFSFGHSVVNIGDIDRDDTPDLVVGAPSTSTTDVSEGAIYILLMNGDGTVKTVSSFNDSSDLINLNNSHDFGTDIDSIGDFDGDGTTDIVVGAPGPSENYTGAVYILYLNSNGTVKDVSIIDNSSDALNLNEHDSFGMSVAGMGDVDHDGITDIAVGAPGDGKGVFLRGALYLLLMNGDGTVKTALKLTHDFPFLDLSPIDQFGASVENIGDFNGDGITDIAVGAPGDSTDDLSAGAVYIIFRDEIPVVTNVSSDVPDGVYGIGNVINITVTFSENVTVYGDGTLQTTLNITERADRQNNQITTSPLLAYPQIILDIGGVDRPANYVSGSGTNVLTFGYVVLSGDNTFDLDYTNDTALVLNNVTIIDDTSNNANIILAIPGTENSLGYNKDIRIDTIPPTFTVDGNIDDFIITFELGNGTYTVGTIGNITDNGSSTDSDILGFNDVDVNVVGKYVVNYTVFDLAGNSKTIIETILVADTTPPTFTVNGHLNDFMTVLELSVDAYTVGTIGNIIDADNTADTITGDDTVDVNVTGTYVVNYTVTDESNNSKTILETVSVANSSAPIVTNVTSDTLNGAYGIGVQIDINVLFSGTVTIINGTPQLILEITGSNRAVDYASGNGTDTLTFVYVIRAGDGTTDLDYADTSALVLNGSRITDDTSNNVRSVLAIPGTENSLGYNKDIVVDGMPPTFAVNGHFENFYDAC